jgi:hypothetical protein
MACRQRGEARPLAEKECIGSDHERVGLVADKGGECSIDPRAVVRVEDLKLYPNGGRRCRHFLRHGCSVRIVGIDQQTASLGGGSKFAQQAQLFDGQIG